MNLTIETREAQGVTVLDLKGKLVLGEECNVLRQQIADLLAAGKKKILLNMAELTHADSSGIGILVESVVLSAKQDAAFKLTNLGRVLRNTLAVHRLLPAFEVFESEEEALASYS
jgi:anti-sigma B factor antagonist